MKLKIFLIIAMAILAIGIVSSWDWDNWKSYDSVNREVTITNAIGFGEDLFKAKLLTPNNVYVMRGRDRLVAEFEVSILSENYGFENAFQDIRFYNNSNGREIDRKFTYKIREEASSTPVYETTCELTKEFYPNGSEIRECTSKIVSYYKKYNWRKIKSFDDVPKGTITIGVFADVYGGDYIEWIPRYYGKDVNEWATWTAGFNANLTSYYTFNNSVDVGGGEYYVYDEIGNYNMSMNTSTQQDGIYGNATEADNSGGSSGGLPISDYSTNGFSINWWMNITTPNDFHSGYNYLIVNAQEGNSAGLQAGEFNIQSVNLQEKLYFEYKGTGDGAASGSGTQSLNPYTWQMITFLGNSTTLELYINDTLELTETFNNPTTFSSELLRILGDSDGGNDMDGMLIDELGYWNRTLTSAEITNLYNTGSGLTYDPSPAGAGGVASTIATTLHLPPDTTSTGNTTITFNVSLTPQNLNLTNVTLYIWFSNFTAKNITTLTVTSNNTNHTLKNFSFSEADTYKWNAYGCGDNATLSVCNWSSTGSNYTLTWTPFVIEGTYFTTDVRETDYQSYQINITTNENALTVIAHMNYNETNHTSDVSCNSTGWCIINNDIDVPVVPDGMKEQTKSFDWYVSIFDGDSASSFATSSNNQNVSELNLELCNATYTDQVINLTLYDERNLTRIRNFSYEATFEYWVGTGSERKNHSIGNSTRIEYNYCWKPTTKVFQTDAQIEYSKTGNMNYSRNYYFDNASIALNDSQNVSLYGLRKNYATSFILKVQDQELSSVEDAYVHIQRYYPEDGLYRTVQIARTDENGKSVGLYETEDIDYRHIIWYDGNVALETPRGKIFPEETPYTLTFTIGDPIDYPWSSYGDDPDISTSMSFNSTTNITTFSWIDSTGKSIFGRLVVIERQMSSIEQVVCNKSISFSSGSLTCNVTGYDGPFIAKGYVRKNPILLKEVLNFLTQKAKDVFGNTGLIMGWFIILTISLAFIWNPTAMIIAFNFATLFVSLVGLVSFSPVYLFAMIAISIIIIVVMKT